MLIVGSRPQAMNWQGGKDRAWTDCFCLPRRLAKIAAGMSRLQEDVAPTPTLVPGLNPLRKSRTQIRKNPINMVKEKSPTAS